MGAVIKFSTRVARIEKIYQDIKMVAKHGGFRKGAGRPKGSRNRATIAREARQREALAVARAEDASLMPIDFLLRVLRDPTTPLGRRTAVAKLVTRYLKVHLAEQVICGQGGTVLVRTITDRPSGDAMDAKPNPIARSGKSGSGRPKPFAYEQALGEWRAACACAQRQSLPSHRLAADRLISSRGVLSQLVVVGTDGCGQPGSAALRSRDSAHLRPRDQFKPFHRRK